IEFARCTGCSVGGSMRRRGPPRWPRQLLEFCCSSSSVVLPRKVRLRLEGHGQRLTCSVFVTDPERDPTQVILDDRAIGKLCGAVPQQTEGALVNPPLVK